jgi:hypothetical protein
MSRVRTLGVAALLAALGVAAIPAEAAFADTGVTVNAGSLSMTTPTVANFNGVTLNGAAQDTTASMGTFSVTDATGGGSGWHVTAQATQLAEWDATLNAGAGGYVSGGKTLPSSSLSVSAPSVAANGTTSAAPTVGTGPFTIDGGSAVTVATAAANTGMGTYDFGTSTLTLSVPASAYAKEYRSAVTVSAVTGP